MLVSEVGSPIGGVGSAGAEAIAAIVAQLAQISEAATDAERIDRIKALDHVAAAAAAAADREMVFFRSSQLQQQRKAGVRASNLGRGIPTQIGLARRISPVAAQRQLSTARTLVEELPRTFALMRRGQISDWTAKIIVRETAELSRDDKAKVDEDLCAAGLAEMSPRDAEVAARDLAYRINPHAAVNRASAARSDRRATIRPMPDTMAQLSILCPVEQGVAAYASLDAAAKAAKASGDPRGLGQLRTDLAIERLTGQAAADAVPVEIGLVMSDRSLLGVTDEPAQLLGYGPIPADLGRQLATTQTADAWIRRLYTDPIDDTVTAVDTRRRRFDRAQATHLRYRDQVCRMPSCAAPIRHNDHIVSAASGGATSVDNGQGLCESDNYTKQMPGWVFKRIRGPGKTIQITTPTGHVYESRPPPALGRGWKASRAPNRSVA